MNLAEYLTRDFPQVVGEAFSNESKERWATDLKILLQRKDIALPRGVLRYATPEATALELVGYPSHAGGLSNVATVVAELAEGLDAGKLLEVARLSPISWSQRLGYLLELVGHEELAKTLEPFVHEQANSYTPLRRAAAIAPAKRSAKWKLIINAEVEPDA